MGAGCGAEHKTEGEVLGLEWGPAGCLTGGLPTSTPTSSAPHGGTSTEGARGHLGLPSHTLATVGQSGGFLLLESGSIEPLGLRKTLASIFMDSMLVSFCSLPVEREEQRDCRQSYRSGSEASPCAWGPCLGDRASPTIWSRLCQT